MKMAANVENSALVTSILPSGGHEALTPVARIYFTLSV
jgi:hypothetical protein